MYLLFFKKKSFITILILFILLTTNLPIVGKSFYSVKEDKTTIHTVNATTCDSIPTSFQKIIDLTIDQEFVYGLERYNNGDYLTVGQTGRNAYSPEGFAVRFTPHGDIIWAKIIGVDSKRGQDDFFFNIDIAEAVSDLLIMNDGSTIIVMDRKTDNQIGTTEQQAIIKINEQGKIIWSKLLNHNSHEFFIDNILSDSSNNILISGLTLNDVFFEENISSIIKISQEGTIISQKSFRSPAQRIFSASRLSYLNGSILARPFLRAFPTTNNNQPVGMILFKLDDDLNIISPTKNLISTIVINFSSPMDIINIDSTKEKIYLPGGSSNIDSKGNPHLIILNNELEVLVSKTYTDTLIDRTEFINDFYFDSLNNMVVSFTDSYASAGFDVSASLNESVSFAKLDTAGNLIWHRNYNGGNREPVTFLRPATDNSIMLTGSSFSFGASNGGLYFLRTDSTGYAGDCNEDPYPLIVEDVPMEMNPVELMEDTLDFYLEDFIIPSITTYPVARDVCCDDLPDANLQYALPAYPCGDSIGVVISICNTGTANLPVDYPISIYDQSPLNNIATPSDVYHLSEALSFQDCFQFISTVLRPVTDSIYVIAGDPGDLAPFELPCDFPLNGLTECGYHNNIRTIFIPDTISIVAFDDDFHLPCPSDVYKIDLIAPFYLENPIWNGIYHEDTIQVHEYGTYVLQGTTPCGDIFIDSLEVTGRYPGYSFPFADTTICLGDTLSLTTPAPYENTRWQVNTSDLFYDETCSATVCPNNDIVFTNPGEYIINGRATIGFMCFPDDVINVTVRPALILTIDTSLCPGPITFEDQVFNLTTDTILSFSYLFSEFCDSTIQYAVNILDTSYQVITLTACAGDSILFQDTQIAAGNTQTFVNTNTNGCDSTIFVSVQTLEPSPITEIFLDFCTGDSILIFNNYQQLSGIYSNNFTNINGCDSLVQITLTELPVFQTENLITICSGASVLVHGQSETQAGFYEALFTAQNGCDSIAFIELDLYATASLEAEITASCPDETNGEISLTITEGDGPFFFDWSDGNIADSIRQDLGPGSYTLTLTDVNGCTSIHGYNVPTLTREEDCAPHWYAPNAFSPNDDGRNDRFTFYANARMDRIELLEIFDRGGNLVFRGKDLPFDEEMMGWDGYLKGQLMTPQVFVWRAVVVDGDGRKEDASGDMTLMQ